MDTTERLDSTHASHCLCTDRPLLVKKYSGPSTSFLHVTSSSVDVGAADLISDVLRSVHLQGTVYFEAQVESPWGIHIPDNGVANFHLVTSGSCVADVPGEETFRLYAGDAVVFPHGSSHTIGYEPGHSGVDGTELFQHMDGDGVVRLPHEGGDRTTIICGHFDYDNRVEHPLFQALPKVLHAPAGHHPGWKTIAEMAVQRSRDLSPGSRALTDRLAEVLVIELLSDLDMEGVGFMGALSDPVVASALQVIHQRPDHDWTVAELACEVAVSRSTLAARFTELVGESPIRYLTRWRMHRATELLVESTKSAGEVGYAVGYQSPYAFTRAFTRLLGEAPSTYRARVRQERRNQVLQ